jgi:hypothetical protein
MLAGAGFTPQAANRVVAPTAAESFINCRRLRYTLSGVISEEGMMGYSGFLIRTSSPSG